MEPKLYHVSIYFTSLLPLISFALVRSKVPYYEYCVPVFCDSKSSVICPAHSTSLGIVVVKEAILDPWVTTQKKLIVYRYLSQFCDDAIFDRKLKTV